MKRTANQLVTIVTEAVLENMLVSDIEALGARGYTITDARGKGSAGKRDASWAPQANIRIEVICDAATAHVMCQALSQRYGDNYPMLMTIADVTVLMPDGS